MSFRLSHNLTGDGEREKEREGGVKRGSWGGGGERERESEEIR